MHLQRAVPLIGLLRPKIDLRKINRVSERSTAIHKAIGWLDVERRKRYLPLGGKTYCNVYAYDLVHTLGGYIPRVWWGNDQIARILKGDKPAVVYGKTVFEQSANTLTDWFSDCGPLFSWKIAYDLTEMQHRVNNGTLGVITAQAREKGARGHITLVVPESGALKAVRRAGQVIVPLQTQAGSRNMKYFNDACWWGDPAKFKRSDFWIWDI